MSKKIKQNKPLPAQGSVPGATVAHTGVRPWWHHHGLHAVVVVLLVFGFYWNTVQNDYALDDAVVIVGNEYVHQGLAGIPDILGKDAYYSYYQQLRSSNQLSGGRYRPLSIVTFAIEQQFFGTVPKGATDSVLVYGLGYDMKEPYEKKFLHEMHIRHFFNVLWYALAMVSLLYFLRLVVFRSSPMAALVAAVLFAVHPIHTEVVANVKSRDEIMSLLFICLTFIFAFRYRRGPSHKWWLVAAVASYFLAFLSKEYAITLVVLLPLSFYIFNHDTYKKSIRESVPYFCVALVYLVIRLNVIGPRSELADTDIQINPYAFATPIEKLATEIATSLNYLKLLVFPYPLTSDYSYNQIPYKDFSNLLVWLSLVVHLGLGFGAWYFFRKRSAWCFAFSFFLLNLLMVNNFLFDIGATMGERLVFHASVGFVIAVALTAERLRPAITALLLVGVVVLCAFETIPRNRDWKNDTTLFMKDINASPNSFLVNANVASILVNRSDNEQDEKKKRADLQRAVGLFSHVIGMQDNYVLGYMNRCIAYLKLGEPDSMVQDLDRVRSLYAIHPRLPEMYYYAGSLYSTQKQFGRAEETFKKGLKLNPKDTAIGNALVRVRDSLMVQK